MNFGTPLAVNTILLVGAVVAGLTIVAYILKMRRRRFEVPFSTLWQRVLEEKESSSLWRHLKRVLSLLLMLMIIGLLLLLSWFLWLAPVALLLWWPVWPLARAAMTWLREEFRARQLEPLNPRGTRE